MGLNDFIKVGDRIKSIRKAKGWSQSYVAEKLLNLKRSTYSNYENNNRVPDTETLKKIAKALEVDVSELLGVEDNIPKADYYFDTRLMRDLTHDIFEEVYNHSKAKDEINIFSGDFVKKDKYLISRLANLFTKTTLASIEDLKGIIQNKDNVELKGSLNLMINLKDNNGAVIESVVDLADKLNNKYYITSKIQYYQKLLDNINQGIDNYEIIESGLIKARIDSNEIKEREAKADKDSVIEATQEDFDKF
jgi:transcriptional regulator with XRE-family HTH domain